MTAGGTRRRWRALAALALALAAAPGCTCRGDATAAVRDGGAGDGGAATARRTERIAVTQVAVKVVDPDTPREVYPRLLAQRVGQVLTASDWFVSAADEIGDGIEVRPAQIDLLVTYDVEETGAGGRRLVAGATVEVVWASSRGDLPLREIAIAEAPVAGDEGAVDGLLADHVAGTVEAAARGLIERAALRAGPDEAIVAALRSDDPTRVEWALALVADRALGSAREEVEALLEAPREEVAQAAVGALVAIDDPRSVGPLTDLAEFHDYARMRMLIEAVSAIGGEEATQFLDFVASGHPDAEIKRRAREGLERIRRTTSPR